MSESNLDFNRGAVRPMECMREGWALIKDQYWLFLGITLVGVLIGGAAPMGLLQGPMVCGIHICFLRKMNGQQVGFDHLFKGFNYFLPSFLVSLAMIVPMMLLLVLFYIGFFASMLSLIPALQQGQQQGGPPDPMSFGIFLGLQILLIFGFIVAITLLTMFFVFAFPLIVDRELSAGAALLTGFKAVAANFMGLLGLMVLWNVIGVIVSLPTCYIGLIFLLPLLYGMTTVAYRQVFPMQTLDGPRADEDEVSERAPRVVRESPEAITSLPSRNITTGAPPAPAPQNDTPPLGEYSPPRDAAP